MRQAPKVDQGLFSYRRSSPPRDLTTALRGHKMTVLEDELAEVRELRKLLEKKLAEK